MFDCIPFNLLMRMSFAALAHAIGGILILGYSMEYYFHLRMYFTAITLLIYPLYSRDITNLMFFDQVTTRTTPTKLSLFIE